MPAPVMMTQNLFFGGEIPVTQKKKKNDGSYYWVTTRLIRESGPWYVTCGIKTPDDVYRMVKEYLDLENCDREYFVVIYLNRKGNVTAAEVVSIGGLHSAMVHPREVFKPAILTSSSSVILVHNHPSGDPSPSREDIEITRRLIESGAILGIEVLDHIVIGTNGNNTSFKNQGLI